MIKFTGWDHRYNLDLREAKIRELQSQLVGEYVYLQTCNRVELYNGDGEASPDLVEHIFRVVSGLKSKMIGEAHIQGQVKRAYMEAREENHINSGLHRLFQNALRCGKRVRSETAISTGAVSHSHAAIMAIRNWQVEDRNDSILIIGVNELTQRIISFLNHGHHQHITVANRTVEKIVDMKFKGSVTALSLDELKDHINEFSIIISATTSPDPIVWADWFSADHERLIIDLAVPRDIDSAVKELPNTTLHTVEDLEKLVAHSIEKRENEVTEAEVIIIEEIANYFDEIEKGKRYAQNNK